MYSTISDTLKVSVEFSKRRRSNKTAGRLTVVVEAVSEAIDFTGFRMCRHR